MNKNKELGNVPLSIFSGIFRTNAWGDAESKSGTGSNLIQTATTRQEIPKLLKEYGIKTMLDIPCGDFYWMKEIKADLNDLLDSYTGGDIVPELIQRNQAEYGEAKINFHELDLTNSRLPKVDLVFIRDCLVHLSYTDIYQVLRTIKSSGSKYLLTTHFTADRINKDIKTGEWRPLNLLNKPFSLCRPLDVIDEKCTEDDGIYSDKSLALWKIKDISLTSINTYLYKNRLLGMLARIIKS